MPDPRRATVVGPLDGEIIDTVGDRYRFLVTAEQTNGRYAIWEAIIPPGGGPPPHVHAREEEGFYVVDGELAIHADGDRFLAGPGSFVNMPVGNTHTFRNESDRPAKVLILVAPGGIEAVFRAVGHPVADIHSPITPVDDAEKVRLIATAPAYGIELKIPR